MKLPAEFIQKIKTLLPEKEWTDFFASYNEIPQSGLRVNTLKISLEQFANTSPFALKKIPWAPTGFYYNRQEGRPSKHPFYFAGLYYLQEPSAMTPAAVLNPEPGDKVLDLCAAPGGKTTQLAAAMQGRGILVANDPAYNRVKALVKNLELSGVTNALVTNETPERLAHHFGMFFDKVLVDAPCSGEGMFRKDSDAISAWSEHNSEICSLKQTPILEAASQMVKPGGRLVYSTCTFSPEENELVIINFLRKHPDFRLIDIPKENGIAPGINLSEAARLWPHRLDGEGHFVALLERETIQPEIESKRNKTVHKNKKVSLELDYFYDFCRQYLNDVNFTGNFTAFGEHLYLTPLEAPSLDGLKIIRPGLYLGQMKKNRFEPSHALALTLKPSQVRNQIDFSVDSEEVIRYLKAETIYTSQTNKGWVLISVDGYSLGWAKQTTDILKNYYPIAWRWID